MAIFNPDVPAGRDEMPSWLRQTSPISSLEVDKSAGLNLATLGTGIEGAASIAETTAKDVINKDVRNTVEPIREEYTNQLLTGKAIIQGAGNVTAPASSSGQDGQPLSLLSTPSSQPVPAGIDAGLAKVGSLQAFMQNGAGGKYGADQTYYDMRLKDAVTSLRTRYPGFIDYIDSKVSSITGMNPANELVNDLQRQMAQMQSSKRSEYDKTVDMARKAMGDGLYDAKRMYDYLVQNGEAGMSTYQNYYYETNRKRAVLEEQERIRNSSKADRADMAERRTADWTNEVGTGVSDAMSSFVRLTGVDKPNSLLGFIRDANDNPGKYSAEQLKELGLRFSAQKAELFAQYATRASTTKVAENGSTYSYNSDIGAPNAKAVAESIIGPVYDNIEKALADNKVGLAFAHANSAAGMLDTERNKIYSGPLGENMRKFKILNEDMGSNWASIANTQLIKNSIDKTVDNLFQNQVLAGKNGEKTPEGKQPTYKDMGDKALSLQQSGQISKRLQARYLEGGLNIFLEDITTKDAPIQGKLNALKFFFSPEGQGVLQHFNNDSFDYKSNTPLPGRQTVWGRLTSDSVVAEVKKMSSIDPNIGNMYRQWTEREAGAQLYMKDLIALKGFTGTDDVHIKYNDGEHGGSPNIRLIDKQGNDLKSLGVETTSRRYYQHMQQSVSRVNDALAGMDRVYKGLGNVGNASDALLNFMRESQVDVDGWKGIPEEIMNSIAAARGKGKLKDLMEQGVTK